MSEDLKKEEVMMPDVNKLIISSSPHLHNSSSTSKIMKMVIIAMLPACAAGVYFFGLNALKVLVISTISCMAIEFVWNKIAGNSCSLKDSSAIVTGLLLGMNLSAGVPWWICFVGAILAMVIGKLVYGGLGQNPFNPSLVARVGLLIGFPSYMTTWVPTESTTIISCATVKVSDAVSCATPLATNSASIYDLFIGNVAGCLGETSALAILIGGLFLMAFKIIKWHVPVAFIGSVAIITGLANMISPEQYQNGALYHILAGGVFLGAFFMATDMVTSPMTNSGAFIFGLGCGIITCVIRLWGSYPEGVSFSILIMNALVPLIDRYTAKKPFGFQPPKEA